MTSNLFCCLILVATFSTAEASYHKAGGTQDTDKNSISSGATHSKTGTGADERDVYTNKDGTVATRAVDSGNDNNSSNSSNGNPLTQYFYQPATGYFDSVNPSSCQVSGWAFDPDSAINSIKVHVYRDGAAGAGTFVTECIAGNPRPDVNAIIRIPGNHGFDCKLPPSYADTGEHALYIHAIDLNGQPNRLLQANGKRMSCESCKQGPDITAVDILFIKTGTYIGIGTPINSILIDQANLKSGVSYQPLVHLRNISCNSTSATGYYLQQPLFGQYGSFPVSLQIDFGKDGVYESTQFRGATAIGSNQSSYFTFPAFTAQSAGTHSITVNADVTNAQAPGRGCTNIDTVTVGCIRELDTTGVRSETNNSLTKTFTTVGTSTLQVIVKDIKVQSGDIVSRVPFTVKNNSTSPLINYSYLINIKGPSYSSFGYGSKAGSGSRIITLAPNESDSINGTTTYKVPNSATSLPLEVCANNPTMENPICSLANIIVSTTECSDTVDNDNDGTSDRTDNGCFTNPFDPTTYDKNDNSEGGIIDLLPPTLTLTSDRIFVRTNEKALIRYEIRAPYAITCTLTGAGINKTINHTSGTTNGTELSIPLQNKQKLTLRCPGFTTATTRVIDSEKIISVEVVPQVQEV